jgi:putative ABC transport system permease protein
MKSYDLIELAARNLKQSVLRNSLTTVGISVGVASLVSMLSLGIGLQRLATSRMEKFGFTGITVAGAGRGGAGGGVRQAQPQAQPTEPRVLDDAVIAEISKIPNVAEVYADVRIPAEVKLNTETRRAPIAGLTESARTSGIFLATHGSAFSSPTAPEAMLESRFAASLLGKSQNTDSAGPGAATPFDGTPFAKDLVGRQIDVTFATRVEGAAGAYSILPHTQSVKVVAIVDYDPEVPAGLARASVYLPEAFALSLHATAPGQPTTGYLALTVRTRQPSQVLAVEDRIKKMGFNAFSSLDAQKTMQIAFAVIDVFLGVFGSLALAVASIGIVNTLVMAILERQREIGIMKALGASDTDVRRIFLAEAAAMGVLGGLLGVTFGWLIGRVINFGANIYFKNQGLPAQDLWYVPWWLAVGAIVFAIGVSLAAGTYPAVRASKLDPVEALRYQ